MRRLTLLFVVLCIAVVLCAEVALAQTGIYLGTRTRTAAKLQPEAGLAFMANDFHVKFYLEKQVSGSEWDPHWIDVVLDDINLLDTYFDDGVTDPSEWTVTAVPGGGSYVEMTWTFPTHVVDPTNPFVLGFSIDGGVRAGDFQWWWTLNGIDVKDVRSVFLSTYAKSKNTATTETKNTGTSGSAKGKREVGSDSGSYSLKKVATMGALPNSYEPDGGAEIYIPAGQYVSYDYGASAQPLTYFSRFSGTAQGISFVITSACEFEYIPEPSTLVLLGVGALGLLGCASCRSRR